MKTAFLIFSLIILIVIGFIFIPKSEIHQPSVSPLPSARIEPLKVKVSIPYWDQERATQNLKDNIDKINFVSLFWYFMDGDGNVKKYEYAKIDSSIIEFSHAHGVKVEIVITNLPEEESWDSERVEKVITNNQLRQKHIEEIVRLTQTLGIDGVDIDYEQLDKDLKEDFSRFIKELGEALDEKGKYLGVALHPKTDDGIGSNNDSMAQDWSKLATGADNLYIMGFGEHWDEGEPGPIASISWVQRIVNYAQKLGIDRQRLFLTVPLYGYAWQEESDNQAKGLTHSDVTALLEKYQIKEEWDQKAASPHFHYEAKNAYEVWFENAKSVEAKISLADKAGFAGITFWRLGGEDPAIWQKVQEAIK